MLRRTMAFLIDLFFYGIITIIAIFIISKKWIPIVVAIFYYIGIPIITKGATVGKKIVNIKLLSFKGHTPKWYQYIIRYILLYGVLLPSPFYILTAAGYLTDFVSDSTGTAQTIVMILALAIIAIEYFIIFIHNFILKRMFWYERISKTYNVSTIEIPEKLRGLEDPLIEEPNEQQ